MAKPLMQLNLNVEKPIISPQEQHFWLSRIFLVSVSQEPNFRHLPFLAQQLSSIASFIGAFGGKPSPLYLQVANIPAIINEISPNERGFSELIKCFYRLQNELKSQKDQVLEFLKVVDAKLVEGIKLVLLEQQYRLPKDWNPKAGPLPSELREQFGTLQQDFLTKMLGSCSSDEIQVLFAPIVTEWIVQMGQHCDHGDLTTTHHMSLIKDVSKIMDYPSLVNFLSDFLQTEINQAKTQTGREMEVRSILAAFLGMHVVEIQSTKYFNQIPQYPKCTQDAVYSKQVTLRQALNQITTLMHDNLKKLFTSRIEDGKPQQVLLTWMGKTLELNEVRTTARPNDPLFFELVSICSSEGFLLNLNAVLLMFMKPLTTRVDPPTLKKRLDNISTHYMRYSRIIDFQKHSRVCEIDSPVVFPVDQSIRNGKFGFVSHIFFLTFHSIHVAIEPALENYKNQLNALGQARQSAKELEIQNGATWDKTPVGQRVSKQLNILMPIVDAYETVFGDPIFLVSIFDYFSLFMQWTLKILSENSPENCLSIFSDMPEYFFKDMFDILDFVSRYKPKPLAESQLSLIFDFCTSLLNRTELVRSPLLRARMAILLSSFQALHHQPAFKGIASKYQTHILNEEEKAAFGNIFLRAKIEDKKKLVTGLMRIYIDIGDVEGLDVDKDKMDKYSVRRDIADLLNKLWPKSDFKKIVIGIITTNTEVMSVKFLSTVLSDSIMLLDDSLHRLYDIKSLQEAMANTSEWNSQDARSKAEREGYYKGQERSSKAFLSLANAILDFLINVTEETRSMFDQSPEMLQKLVSMLIYFLGKLCGPQMSKLKVQNPEKYGFDPKGLLLKIATITSYFSDSDDISSRMALDMDYAPEIMEKTCSILQRIKIPAVTLQKFQKFVTITNEKVKSSQSPDAPEWVFPTYPEISSEQDELNEKEYVEAQQLQVFADIPMSKTVDGVEVFLHHYHDNIVANVSSNNQKMVTLKKECRQFGPLLPVSRGSSVFVRVHSNRLDVMKALITGPKGTPYGFGAFAFDIFFPADYPHNPPLVNLETTGHGTVRFNPNLYTDGKVCLSLLGTWHGDADSKWKPNVSNLCQVLISIQGLIMVTQPYYNEPSYEAQRGTKEGDVSSAKYNEQIQYNNIRYAMIEQIQNPTPGFEDAIHDHFYLQRDRIFKECQEWYEAAFDKPKMLRVIQQLHQELIKLEPRTKC